MKKLTNNFGLWGGCAAVVILGIAAGAAVAKDDVHEKDEADVALPAATVIKAIQSAAAAKPGEISKVEAEIEKGKTVVSVEVKAKDGKSYEVNVEASSGKVLGVEQDTEKDEERQASRGPVKRMVGSALSSVSSVPAG